MSIIEPMEIDEIKQPMEVDQPMNLSYNPDWRNDLDMSSFTHISHCFIHRPQQWDRLTEIPDKINGVSIGGWNERFWLANNFFSVVKYTIQEINKRPWIKYLNIDLEYPKSDEGAEAMLKFTRDLLPNNIKLSVACGLWKGHIKYKGCSKYLDWIELMSYDTGGTDISKYFIESLKYLNEIGFPNDKILIGYSNDNSVGSSGDTKKSIEYKSKYVNDYLGRMLWNNPSELTTILEVSDEEMIDLVNWKDNWDKPYRQMTKARTPDVFDNISTFRGNGKCEIQQGVMKLSGSQPRLYVNVNVKDVEASVDYCRIGLDGNGWSGGTIGVRSHPEGHSNEPEKAHTYYFRLKHEGKVDFYRELTHNGNGREIIHSKKFEWNTNQWYNIKFKCYNINGNVCLEGYIDDKLVLKYEDDNKTMYDASGVVFIRNTNIKESRYKNFKILEL